MKRNAATRILALLGALVLLLACVGCGKQPEDASLQKVLDAGQLVLGLDASFPPMGFVDRKGEITGFDIDAASAVCARMGVTLVKKPIDWDAKEDLLNSGEIDCIWNGMSVTPARAESMDLSEPYMRNEMVFVVLGSSGIRSKNELSGRTVGVQSGSSAEELLDASPLAADMTVTQFPDNVTMLDELAEGRLDAAFLDSVVAYYYISSSGDQDLFVLPGGLGKEEYAIGFRKGDLALRDRVQEALNEMRRDGTLTRISLLWFGSDITPLR